MKILIWFGCILAVSFIKAFLFGGVSLGAIPAMILYGAAFAAATALSKAWDNHKSEKSANKDKEDQ